MTCDCTTPGDRGLRTNESPALMSLSGDGCNTLKVERDRERALRYHMPVPSTILLFGASGRISPAVARYIHLVLPDTKIRLATTKPDRARALAESLPGSVITHADYFNRASLERALDGVEAVFLITPSFIDEVLAMTNFIAAAKASPSLRHIIRIVGDPPGMRLERVPQVLKDFGGGTAIQHLVARDMIERSGLPTTFLNITNTYVDNFRRSAAQIGAGRWVVARDRLIGYVDPMDVGEAAARIMLSRDRRHIHQHFNVDNGEKPRRSSDVAKMIADVIGRPVQLIVSEKQFAEQVGPALDARYGHSRGADFMIEYLRFEEANELTWRQSDFLETTLERPPITLRGWLETNRAIFKHSS